MDVRFGCEESWALKKWCFDLWCWRRLLRFPWTARRSNQSILKEFSPEYSLEGLMHESETPILWPPDEKSWLIGKDPDARKDRRQEKGMTEDEMVGWHQWVNGHKFEQTPGDGEGQGSLECCSSWSPKELDRTERLNNNQGTGPAIQVPATRGTVLSIACKNQALYISVGPSTQGPTVVIWKSLCILRPLAWITASSQKIWTLYALHQDLELSLYFFLKASSPWKS